MKKPWFVATVIGISLAGTIPAQAQHHPMLRLTLDADLVQQPAFQELFPSLHVYAASMDNGDITALRSLTAPGFRFSKAKGEVEEGAAALRSLEILVVTVHGPGALTFSGAKAVSSGRPMHLKGQTLEIMKFFPRRDRDVILLNEMADYTPPTRQKEVVSTSLSWTCQQTWVKTAAGWKLAQVDLMR